MRKLFLLVFMAPILTAGDCNGGDQPRRHVNPTPPEQVAPVPEPTSAIMFVTGVLCVAAALRRRK